jgi:isoleucyl-tRNA synthetase
MSNEKPLSFLEKEERVLKFWQEAEIFKQSINREAPLGNFVFYEGPPTANGLPGIHHVLARAFKDCLPRYKTMKGFKVLRKAGWDTHGLPVELKVEKDLNLSGKKDIEKYGIAEFNQKCKESVWQYTDEWKKLTNRIAFWLDLDNPYITYENDYINSLWWAIKELYNKGLLYKGHKVVPHCPRCGTALSSHEVAQGYKLVKDISLTAKFKLLKDGKSVKAGDFILAWTTTPWTLPGNVALAVGEDIDYVRVKHQGEYLILAKARLAEVIKGEVEILAEFKGQDLVDLFYQPLFPLNKIFVDKKAHYLTKADFVNTEEGTGIVHTAVMYGEDDYNLGKEIDLPKIHTVDEAGKFIEDLKDYNLAGRFVKSKKTEEIIINYLKEHNYLLEEKEYEHDYPYCWRCDTPLLYYAKDSWFIKMSALKEQLIKNNQEINWTPSHIKEGRFGEWLNNVKDWAISRERYWGTPLPIWVCNKCEQIKCIGSKEELEVELEDLHRPFIDEIKFKCSCGGEMIRDKSVLDCWFDSGMMPLAQHHYPFKNKDLIDKNEQFPADFICEAIDQTRGWFYTLLALSTALNKGVSYKNVICLGHINDKFGKKMSKSKGNVIDPWQVIKTFGVDAIRQHMYTVNQPGEGKKYDLDDVKSVFRQNIMLLNNVYRFYNTYIDDQLAVNLNRPNSPHILDKWFLARLDQTIEKISSELDNYHIYEAAREIPLLIDDLSTWYLRRSRERFKGEDEKDKQIALNTTAYSLLEISKLMAPFMPFIAEDIWQSVTGFNFKYKDKSVHLSSWSEVRGIDEKILDNMSLIRKLVELGLAARDEAGIKVRQKLAKATIKGKEIGLSEDYLKLLAEELNVLEVDWQNSEADYLVELNTKLTPELKLAGLERDIIRLVNAFRKEAGLSLEDKTTIHWSGSDQLEKSINQVAENIKKATLSDQFNRLEKIESAKKKKIEFEGEEIEISLI